MQPVQMDYADMQGCVSDVLFAYNALSNTEKKQVRK
jgi:hypothetical protein